MLWLIEYRLDFCRSLRSAFLSEGARAHFPKQRLVIEPILNRTREVKCNVFVQWV